MRLLLTRPLDESARLARKLEALGHECLVEPLLSVVPRAGVEIPLDGVRGLLATSANGVRAMAATLTGRSLPVYAVGPTTATAARDAGFTTVHVAAGDVDALVELVEAKVQPGVGRLVHVAGRDVSGDLAGLLRSQGHQVDRIVLYDAVEAPELSAEARAALTGHRVDGALFFSPRTAATFVTLALQAGIAGALTNLAAFCLSSAVATTLNRLALGPVTVSPRPTEDSLIERIGNWKQP